jgi:hypothetical protein
MRLVIAAAAILLAAPIADAQDDSLSERLGAPWDMSAKDTSGYKCLISHAYFLGKDDLEKQPKRNFWTMWRELDPSRIYDFTVDRATGRMTGRLNDEGGTARVLDDAHLSGQNYKVIYASDPGGFTTARYLAIHVWAKWPNKPFILTENTTVLMGTCTPVR